MTMNKYGFTVRQDPFLVIQEKDREIAKLQSYILELESQLGIVSSGLEGIQTRLARIMAPFAHLGRKVVSHE